MKKALFYCMLPMLLFACSKGNKSTNPPPKTGNKTYTVKFNVSASGNALLTTNTLHTTDAAPVPVSSYANRLNYWVYDSNGNLVTQLLQTSTTPGFGQITDTFAAGTYTIVMLAQNASPYAPGFALPPTNIVTNANTSLNGSDSFLKSFTLTVTNSTINQDVTLVRVDGQLQIKITDTIPVTAVSIQVGIGNEYFLSATSGLPTTPIGFYETFTLPDSVKGKPNYIMNIYLANTVAPFSVQLKSFDATGAAIATANINNITCSLNTRTLLTGALFNNGSGYGFTISFNDTWDNSPITIPFNQVLPATKQATNKKGNN